MISRPRFFLLCSPFSLLPFSFFHVAYLACVCCQVPHPSMRFDGHGDHEAEEEAAEHESAQEAASGRRRFSLPGAMLHPELRYHSEIQEPVVQGPPPTDGSIASHPNRRGRMVPGTVPHVSSRLVSLFAALVMLPSIVCHMWATPRGSMLFCERGRIRTG